MNRQHLSTVYDKIELLKKSTNKNRVRIKLCQIIKKEIKIRIK